MTEQHLAKMLGLKRDHYEILSIEHASDTGWRRIVSVTNMLLFHLVETRRNSTINLWYILLNLKDVFNIILVFLLLTLSKVYSLSRLVFVEFRSVFAGWDFDNK